MTNGNYQPHWHRKTVLNGSQVLIHRSSSHRRKLVKISGRARGARIIGGEGVSDWGHHGECGTRAYNGCLRAEPRAGSSGRAPGQGVTGANPSEAESILVNGCPTEPANLAPFQKCICISTLGATVMIWENLCRNQGGSGDPPCPFLGAPMTTQTILLFCCV